MTIAHLSSTTPSRWGEFAPSRAAEAKEPRAKSVDQTERAEADPREGPRRSPLFGAIRSAIEELVAQAQAPAATEAAQDTPAAGAAADSDALAQAITEFARALMHALHDGRGPHGQGRGLHLGHTLGRHLGWGDAAQRVEKLAQDVAPEPAPKPVEVPVDTAPAALPVEPAESAPATEITEAAVAAVPAAQTPAPSLHVALDLGLPESPWKAVHDDLIESFAELQRAIGGPDTDRDESLEEQLREMLVALAIKLQTHELHTAALAPPGSLLSVVA